MKIYNDITELIGGTPLIKLSHIEKDFNLKNNIIAKAERFNPAGSVKDRIGLAMIEEAEKNGKIKPGATLIEPTSGNTGIGLAAVAAVRGYKLILTMPDTMSVERRKLLAAYGAEIVLTEGKLGMAGAVDRAKELLAVTPGSFMPSQFDNPANPAAHIASTGPEIWEDTDGKTDVFIAGVGTGGTLSGVGRYLKSKNSNIKVIAVEPESSPVLSKGVAGAHGIQGIGANFVPGNFDCSVVDEIITVTTEESYDFGRMLCKREGLLSGISSGAALCAAVKYSQRGGEGLNIVVLFPDTGERYLTTKMFEE